MWISDNNKLVVVLVVIFNAMTTVENHKNLSYISLTIPAHWLLEEFLTETAIAVIVALLILLVNPKNTSNRAICFLKRCPVCDKRLIGNSDYAVSVEVRYNLRSSR